VFLYGFNKHAGQDRVFVLRNSKKNLSAGDLIVFGQDMFLVLGEDVSFAELYSYEYRMITSPEIVYKSLLSQKTMSLLHRMTYTRYASYKSVVKYFLPQELNKFLDREPKKKSKKPASASQELYIFPDLWTLYNSVPLSAQNNPQFLILSSQMSDKQLDLARRNIKKNLVSKVFCTHAQIFQDRGNLTKIYLHEPHKWYYANAQEPRYKTAIVVEEMRRVWGIKEQNYTAPT